jgi:hypothetical protein
VKKRIFLLFGVFIVLLVARAPAVLLDSLVARLSADALHLREADGTIWQGRGLLVGSEAAQRSGRPWLHLHWRFLPAELLEGRLGWSLADGEKALGEASYGLRGLHLEQISLLLPAEIVRLPLDNPVFNSGWRGDIAIESPEWTWRPGESNRGRIDLVWRGAGTALLPAIRLGDYRVTLVGEGEVVRLLIVTLAGDVQVSGSGMLSHDGHLTYDGRIEGDPDLLRSLPAVSAEMVRQDGVEGRFVVHVPALPR